MALFLSASTLSGAVIGAALGELGMLAGLEFRSGVALPLLAGVAIVGLCIDLSPEWRLPSPRRQVNDAWLHTYRRWVYAVGFGAQLGVGIATVVNSTALYAAFVAAAATGSPAWGAGIIALYGALRGLAVLATWRVNAPLALTQLISRAERTQNKARIGLLYAYGLANLTLLAGWLI